MKTLREMMDLIESAQQGVAEGPGFDKWADERAASQLHKLKKPHPETWHDVDKKLGKAVDKMSQAEKVKKGFAHPDTLKKKGVTEGSDGTVSFREMIDVVDQHYPKYYAELSGSDISDKQFERAIVNAYNEIIKKQGVAEEQLEETTPEALAKIDELTRK